MSHCSLSIRIYNVICVCVADVVIGISFTPRESGDHYVSVYRNGQPIAGSPFKVVVGPTEIGNASKVRTGGRGLTQAVANQLNEFFINTRDAGAPIHTYFGCFVGPPKKRTLDIGWRYCIADSDESNPLSQLTSWRGFPGWGKGSQRALPGRETLYGHALALLGQENA